MLKILTLLYKKFFFVEIKIVKNTFNIIATSTIIIPKIN